MCVNNLSKVALDSATAGIEPATSSRKSNALTTAALSHTCTKKEISPRASSQMTATNLTTTLYVMPRCPMLCARQATRMANSSRSPKYRAILPVFTHTHANHLTCRVYTESDWASGRPGSLSGPRGPPARWATTSNVEGQMKSIARHLILC